MTTRRGFISMAGGAILASGLRAETPQERGRKVIDQTVLALGGDGLISVVSNVVPKLMTELVRLGRAGSFEEARAVHLRLLPWMRSAFVESNPLPVKAALTMMGKFENVLRSPLVPMAASHDGAVRDALRWAGALP